MSFTFDITSVLIHCEKWCSSVDQRLSTVVCVSCVASRDRPKFVYHAMQCYAMLYNAMQCNNKQYSDCLTFDTIVLISNINILTQVYITYI